MLAIRFNRIGKKDQAAFRIVLQEKGRAPGRKHVEMLGSYEPHMKQVVLKKERILYWLGQGAQASDSVHNLLVKEGVVTESKRVIKMEKPAVKEEPAPEVAPAPAVPEVAAAEPVASVVEEAAAVVEAPVVAEVPTEIPAEAAVKEESAPVEAVAEEKAA